MNTWDPSVSTFLVGIMKKGLRPTVTSSSFETTMCVMKSLCTVGIVFSRTDYINFVFGKICCLERFLFLAAVISMVATLVVQLMASVMWEDVLT